MTAYSLESAVQFTPGRASFITTGPEGDFVLNLTEASSHRATVAANLFDPEFHTSSVYAGGYPGIAQNWPAEHTPALGNREADLMALPLITRLVFAGWDRETIDGRVKRQGESNNSIGDVLVSIENGLLDPNDFHRDSARHGIHLNTGGLHGMRFRDILTTGLDIDKRLIVRADMRDVYGTPATEFRGKEPTPVAIAKECAAIAITKLVLKDVRPGNIEDLRDAEQRFNQIATKSTK